MALILQWGNSQGLKASKAIMKKLHLSVSDTKIIIKPIQDTKIKYDLSVLVNQVPQNYMSQEEFSIPMSSEKW